MLSQSVQLIGLCASRLLIILFTIFSKNWLSFENAFLRGRKIGKYWFNKGQNDWNFFCNQWIIYKFHLLEFVCNASILHCRVYCDRTMNDSTWRYYDFHHLSLWGERCSACIEYCSVSCSIAYSIIYHMQAFSLHCPNNR